MRRLMTATLLVSVLACLALPTLAQTVTRSELISDDSLSDATGSKELTHTFSQEPRRVRVSVDCRLKKGSFAWRVEAPDGETTWHRVNSVQDAEEGRVWVGHRGMIYEGVPR